MKGILRHFYDHVRFVGHGQSKPHISAMLDAHIGLATTQCCQPARWAERLTEVEHAEYDSVYRRSLAFLNNPAFDLEQAWHRLRLRNRRQLCAHGGKGVVVPVDYVGVEHRHADIRTGRGMDGIVVCHHGSRGIRAPGHPHVVIQAVTRDGLQAPLLFRPWNWNKTLVGRDGKTAPRWKNYHQPFLESIDEVRSAVGPQAIFALDRGFFPRKYAEFFDRRNLNWVIRVSIAAPKKKDAGTSRAAFREAGKGGMTLAALDGTRHRARALAEDAPTVATFKEQRTRDARRGDGPRRVQVCAVPVRLTTKSPHFAPIGPVRTLIASFTEGRSSPLVVLASEELTSVEDILRYRTAYLKRWPIETTIRHGKNRASWGAAYEDTRQLRWEGVERMAFLVASYQTLLGRLAVSSERTMQPLLGLAPTPSDDPADWRYRLAHGLSRYLQEQLYDLKRRLRRNGGPAPRTRAWHGLFPFHRED